MSDSDWSEDLAPPPPPKKSGLGKWIAWGCGCGCLLFLIGALVAGVGAFRLYKKGSDQEVVWPRVAEFLPFDERPEELFVFGFDLDWLDVEWFLIMPDEFWEEREAKEAEADTEAIMVQVTVYGPGIPFREGLEASGLLRVEEDTLELQGREIDVLWHGSGLGMAENFPDAKASGGRTLAVDLSTEEHTIVLQLQSLSPEPLDAERVEAFLEPFDLWSGR